MTELPIRGTETGVRLDRAEALLAPRHMGAWGYPVPDMSEELLQLSAELAASCYGMRVEPWLQAGWRDPSVLADGRVVEAFDRESEPNLLRRIAASLRLKRIRRGMKPQGAIRQMVNAVRRINTSGECNALVMLHPTVSGRYVVAIGLMGTGRQLADWIPNFRLMADNGVHRGFMQLARQLERHEDAVTFPDTAARLGLERLTLSDIIDECRHEDSRFMLWLAGHSQGGAVMQAWAYLKLTEDGVLPGNLTGCGFASPRVVTGNAVPAPAAYPLLHVVHEADLVPRLGAMAHLGTLLSFRASGAEGQAKTPAAIAAAALLDGVHGMPDVLISASAYLTLLSARRTEEMVAVLGSAPGALARFRALAAALEGQRDRLFVSLLQGMEDAYRSLTGQTMPRQRVLRAVRRMRSMADDVGLRALTAACSSAMRAFHGILGTEDGQMGVYARIVTQFAHELAPAVWQSGMPPLMLPLLPARLTLCAHVERLPRRALRLPHRTVSRRKLE